ncbi:phosphoethanolamine transferase [Sinimarinibacterium flocculans]|uniref:Phosphatidylethanolamine:Kdo2-lipid A phosphoethanolamine transferase n=1 Tax=Sinimarinibacterium flocculans TaxID=985250 RepID=A0A318EJ35_9GAMM|nr:phosphatidylethanolamine:Kdo2-lipid A phosphoethanolamine transferase [Sinimarinibacterium flocculans]
MLTTAPADGVAVRSPGAARAARFRRALPRPTGATLLLIVSIYLACTQNTALWAMTGLVDARALGWSELLILLTLFLILVAGTFTLAALVCVGPLYRVNVALLIVVAVAANHFMSRYGVVVDTQMIVNVTRTDAGEAGELLTADLLVRLLVFAGLPILLLWWIPLRGDRWVSGLLRRLGIAVALWAAASSVLALDYKDASLWAREHSAVRKYPNPVLPVVSAFEVALQSVSGVAEAAELAQVATRVDPRPVAGRRRIVVLVVGETARADHFSLYGYDRQTTPELENVADLLRFDDVQSCGTSTAVSVPCMFSRLDREAFDRQDARRQENLLDVLARGGVAVSWRDNNTGCQGVCARVPSEQLSKAADPRLCDGGECHDEILLAGLRERLLSQTGDQLVVLHQLGSHGPSYYRRYPNAFAAFGPVCTLDEAYRCEREALVNGYDNTIRYTDHVLADVIRTLQSLTGIADVAMLYVSDHGESLGESGLYLHGFPYALAPEAQKHVPMLAWFGASFTDALRIDRDCAARQAARPLSHDNLFDIVLGLFDVGTDAYRAAGDVLGACRSDT